MNFIVLLMTLLSASALALNDDQKSMLKQLTLQEYEKLDLELKEHDLYTEAESYINRAMSAIKLKKIKHFFVTINKKIAKQMGIKATDKTAKFGIPYTPLRSFNLVQAMIHYDRKVNNSAASFVTNYADRLLSESGITEQEPTKNIAWINILYENRINSQPIPTAIKTLNSKQNYILSESLSGNVFHKKIYLLRNGEFVFTNVNMIRNVHLKDGDKIISPLPDFYFDHLRRSPIKNPASRAREIYIAVNRLRAFLDKHYPEKFSLSINDKDMFEVSLDFIAARGLWEDAFFRIVFNFDNYDEKEPDFDVRYSPELPLIFNKSFALHHKYRRYKRNTLDLHNEFPDDLSVEKQILNIINSVTDCINTKTKDVFLLDWLVITPQDNFIKEIMNATHITQQEVNTPVCIDTDSNKIEKSMGERIKDEEDRVFDNLTEAELDSESIRTDIFLPVKMYNEAEIVELDYASIKNFYDLIYEARRKSGFIIPKDIVPVVYYKNKKLDQPNVLKVLHGIKKGNTKWKKKHDILTVVVNVPGYERLAFDSAKHQATNYYVPEHTCHLMQCGIIHKRNARKPIKWEIHLFENKKQAKASTMFFRHKLLLPSDTQKTTERYRGGATPEGPSNVWIPTVRDDMSEVQKRFALMSMYDLSRYKFSIPNDLKKASVSNLGNDIIISALSTPQENKWLLSQVHLEFFLQRIQMSILINHDDYSVAKNNNAFFESVISGTIDENIIEDLIFFLPRLTPGLTRLSRMDTPNKSGIIYRIILNYLIEICVRTLTYNESDASSGIIKQLIEKPEAFSLKDLYASNKQGIVAAFDVLKIADFLFTKTLFNPLYKESFNPLHNLSFNNDEIKSLLIDIKNTRKTFDSEENIIPVILNHLLPTAKYYSSDLDFESKEFLNQFILSILKNYGSRTKNKEVKASLLTFLKNTEQKSDFFSQEKTDELISSFRKTIPELLVNVPNGKGGFRQTCYRCNKVYETKSPIRGKGRTTNRTTGKPKEKLVKPFHNGCMKEDKHIRKLAGQLFKEMEKGYPKKQFFEPDYSFNPVPDGFELIRVNGDGNCMYSSIAEIFNQSIRTSQVGVWDQKKVRQMMHYNLRQIYSVIQNHPDQQKLMQELGLLSGIDADLISAVVNNYVIIHSASSGQSELGRLQQFGDAQLMTLLVPTQGVWFPVITQGDYGSYHEIYDLRRWVRLAPNLLAMLLQKENYRFPDLTKHQRAMLLQSLLEQNFDQAEFLVSQFLVVPHLSSAYLIHYPSSVALLEHFDAAVNIEASQNMAVNSSRTTHIDETLQDSTPLLLMIQTTTLSTPTSTF
ncbi:hypothetical protein [Endozoicomonas sp. 4G]|uniref:hypothetical protein n=1 Tax=Endozoicomonas sp. 4G TaxID=2872754 RepID=UPI00207881BB|nr:hypothetical protein [Endozoicomonas sp. 4G]